MSELAIVIPAYKEVYFEKTLRSIANQTCKDFTLYVGNDSSPYDIKSIIDQYQDSIPVVYKHFDENLGGKDLVAHWERCIDMVGNEDWIWLFSDDDIMDPDCVANFYTALQEHSGFDLFHFNVVHIDDERKIHKKLHEYPEVLSSREFLDYTLDGGYSFVVEYIFRKSHFIDLKRFQHFDLAWFSDTATWIKLGEKNGIKTIEGSNVYFRTSQHNITPNVRDREILKRKIYSQVAYIRWILERSVENPINSDNNKLRSRLDRWFIRTLKGKIEFIPFNLLYDLTGHYCNAVNRKSSTFPKFILLVFIKIYRFIVEVLKKIVLWKHIKNAFKSSATV